MCYICGDQYSDHPADCCGPQILFVSRHKPTDEQIEVARDQDCGLIHIGDCDAFSVTPEWIEERIPVGIQKSKVIVAVVHPAAALRLASSFRIAVFENSNRSPEGEKPQFFCKELHVFDNRK
jgi:hypothetical protein